MEGLTSTDGTFEIRPIGAFGAEIDMDLARDIAVDPEIVLAALDRYGVLVFRRQQLERAALVAFSALFGIPVRHVVAEYLAADHPEVMVLSNNFDETGKREGAPNNGIFWHSDQIHRPKPVSLTLLYGREVPPDGGDTLFADMRAIYDALAPDLRDSLEGCRAIHSFCASYDKNYREAVPLTPAQRAQNPDVDHPVFRTHPRTGRKSVFVDPDSTVAVHGWNALDSQAAIRTITECIELPASQYRHRWQTGDLVVWDNRCLMHRATGYDDSRHRRVMWRTQVEGEVPV
jgi:taurine dioxygenase